MCAMSMPRSVKATVSIFLIYILTSVLTPIPASALAGAREAADTNPLPPSITNAPLSADQVVARLIRNDEDRARALRHYESSRVYHLSYRGFPGDRDAEMTVEATFDGPSTKNFKIVSQKGSKLILDRVFKRLL